jgi:hypothetical protein
VCRDCARTETTKTLFLNTALEVVRIVVELRRRSRWVDGQTVTGSATS